MKRLIVSFCLIFVTLGSMAQNIADVFVKMPDEMILQLENAWRKDLVDLYRAGKTATLENIMLGKSSMLKLTEDYLLLQSSERSQVEMKMLPLVNNTYILCVVTTLKAPVEDSRVEFYTTDWNRLATENLLTLVDGEWFFRDDVDRQSSAYLDAVALLDVDLVKYSLDESKNILTAEYKTPDYLNDEDKLKINYLLKEGPKVYEWKLSRFE